MNKQDILAKFVEEYKDKYVQLSKEWFEIKEFTIGGSEISTLVNKNPYRTVKDLYYSRAKLNQFNGNIFTNWGVLMEDVVIKILESLLTIKVETIGSVPSSKIPGLRYSPDGLFYYNDKIILLEIKCPFARFPKGFIPKHYLPQVLTGLHVIDITDEAWFVDVSLKRCSLFNFRNNNNFKRDVPIPCFSYRNCKYIHGYTFILLAMPSDINPDMIGEYNYKYGCYDAGEIEDFNNWLTLANCCRHKYYSNPIRHEKDIEKTLLQSINLFKSDYNVVDPIVSASTQDSSDTVMESKDANASNLEGDSKYIVILPIKIYKFSRVKVTKSEKFMKECEPKIYTFLDNVKKLARISSKEEKKKLIDNNFITC